MERRIGRKRLKLIDDLKSGRYIKSNRYGSKSVGDGNGKRGRKADKTSRDDYELY